MPTRAMSGSQGGARPGSPGVGGPGLQSGPEHPPAGGTAPRRAATGQFGCSRLLPAGMCDRAVLVGDMTAARPGALHPAHTRQAHGGGQGPGAAIRPPSPRPTADAERPGPRRAEHGPPAPPRGYGAFRTGPWPVPSARPRPPVLRLFLTHQGPVGQKVPRARPSGGIAPSGVVTLLSHTPAAGQARGPCWTHGPESVPEGGRREIYVAAAEEPPGRYPRGIIQFPAEP